MPSMSRHEKVLGRSNWSSSTGKASGAGFPEEQGAQYDDRVPAGSSRRPPGHCWPMCYRGQAVMVGRRGPFCEGP